MYLSLPVAYRRLRGFMFLYFWAKRPFRRSFASPSAACWW